MEDRTSIGGFALLLAIVGLVFGAIPGHLIEVLGWLFLPIALVLGIVGMCRKSASKRASVAAVVVSVVGLIVASVVLNGVLRDIEDAMFGHHPPEPTVTQDGVVVAGAGTKDDPAAIGATISLRGWNVVINSFTPVVAGSINSLPRDTVWSSANVTITNTYRDPNRPDLIDIDYIGGGSDAVRAAGGYLSRVFEPRLDTSRMLAYGESTTGNVAFDRPRGPGGMLRVAVYAGGPEAYVAID
ncbi:hypothetical protein nbrc107696_27470 [Gordonia spumicola]|uniref:DUF4352 domain-containing protein n=1 Tax=Gordonia spumicola TaxID=589161 RepID=A0A7I9VAZ9_9ACTN|nr:DUF4352 domain-containing protein [Gordonia spumicola]GEE02301.1 hypothetical protein nbrc107696_27470 [Gordonia spumicola]